MTDTAPTAVYRLPSAAKKVYDETPDGCSVVYGDDRDRCGREIVESYREAIDAGGGIVYLFGHCEEHEGMVDDG